MLDNVLVKYKGVEVSAMEVYSDMFHLGDNMIQKHSVDVGDFKANPLGYWKNNKDSKGHYRILFEDTFEETLQELQEADFCIVNGLSYFGRKNVQEHASKMYAMIFDLDGVTEDTLSNFLHSCFSGFTIYPLPNYIILSGHGVHLYYVFEQPISLYPNLKIQLKELKYSLTIKIWNRYTTEHWEKVQYQGINQGFRVIGGKTKVSGVKVRAFLMRKEHYTLNELNQYISEEKRIDDTKLWKESKLTLEQAKKKYPEWYEKRVVGGEKQGRWTCKEDLYHWWIRKIQDGASVGHRYFCIMCLAIYGVKSGIGKEQVVKDSIDLIPFLNGLDDKEPFTESDVKSALECFDERYVTFPIDDISKISGILIEKNKRNGRKQELHLKIARATRDIIHEDWREGNGRPEGSGTKKKIIAEWKKCHVNGTKAECNRDTKIDPKTIRKWWKS